MVELLVISAVGVGIAGWLLRRRRQRAPRSERAQVLGLDPIPMPYDTGGPLGCAVVSAEGVGGAQADAREGDTTCRLEEAGNDSNGGGHADCGDSSDGDGGGGDGGGSD